MSKKKVSAKKPRKLKSFTTVEVHKRTAEEQKVFDEAVRKQTHDNKIMREVWAGKKPKKALLKKENGGESHSQGVGDTIALREFGPRAIAHGKKAHDKLFARMVEEKSAKNGKPVGRPRGATNRGTSGVGDYAGKKVTLLAKENPKRGKSAERFALYKTGMTVEEFVAAGGTVADVKWDVGKGFIKLS